MYIEHLKVAFQSSIETTTQDIAWEMQKGSFWSTCDSSIARWVQSLPHLHNLSYVGSIVSKTWNYTYFSSTDNEMDKARPLRLKKKTWKIRFW